MVDENITGQLTRAAVLEYRDISHKSMDWIAANIGVDTTTLRLWLNNPARNGIDHLVTAFIAANPPVPTVADSKMPQRKDTHKWCPRCGFTLPIAQFMVKASGTVARSTCRECTNETYREQYGTRTGATQ